MKKLILFVFLILTMGINYTCSSGVQELQGSYEVREMYIDYAQHYDTILSKSDSVFKQIEETKKSLEEQHELLDSLLKKK